MKEKENENDLKGFEKTIIKKKKKVRKFLNRYIQTIKEKLNNYRANLLEIHKKIFIDYVTIKMQQLL